MSVSVKRDVEDVLKKVVTKVMLFVWGATTIVVALAGPFGTYDALSLPLRLGYWGVVIATSVVLAIMFRVFWHLIIKADPEWLEDTLVIGSLALVFGPLVSSLNRYLWPGDVGLVSWQMISFVTFAIGIGTVALRHVVQAQETDETGSQRDRLLERIDAPSDARLGRISSDNHHIRIITREGNEFRVLMRLRDAVADINIEPGFCVHRSHWVATERIDRVEEKDGREVVRLKCGDKVPVGPKYRTNLIAAGVLSA